MASLRDLGLSEYEARVYRALLTDAPTTAKELSRTSEVPMGRIYDVLNSLEALNLVRSQTASRPKKYVAVEPSTALDRLLENKRQELEEKARQYEGIVDTLIDELDVADPVEGQFWTAAVGPEDTIELLVERLDAAEERIVMVAGNPSPAFDLGSAGEHVIEHLDRALERGVDISVLLTREMVSTLPPTVGERYSESFSDHPRFAVRTNDNLEGTYNIIDDVEVCIEVTSPLESGEAFAMIDLKDPEYVSEVHQEFANLWREAEPLSF
jgi:sugar-specific transcriptional regulator TrmB